MKTDIEIIKEKYNIKDFLDYAGIEYKIDSNHDLLVKSPANLRQKTESLRVRANYKGNYNYFKDFLTNKVGDILNFVEYYYNLNTKEAIEELKKTFNEHNLDRLNEIKEKNNIFIQEVQQKLEKEKNNNIEIKKIQTLQNQALIDYLQTRGIDLQTGISAGIKEIYYQNKKNNKNYFGLAFENNSGGFEVRNAYFKGSFGTKDITTFENSKSNEINIFEGFLDYVSAIKLSKGKILQQNNIILNSVAETKKAIEAIEKMQHIKKVKLYLDNDNAGKEATKLIKNELSKRKKELEIIDNSSFYKHCKDINDFLQEKLQLKKNLDKGIENER